MIPKLFNLRTNFESFCGIPSHLFRSHGMQVHEEGREEWKYFLRDSGVGGF